MTDHQDAARAFYVRVLQALNEAKIPYLIAGAYALRHYTGVMRDTKDVDVFCRSEDKERILETAARLGYKTSIPAPHWLGKVHCGDHLVDVIWCGSNGVTTVDQGWFDHAEPGELFGLPVRFAPVEEMIWSKAFVMERERYDGADVMHLLRARGATLDWRRLVARFGPNVLLLYHYLVLFRFDYPGERVVPRRVWDELDQRLRREVEAEDEPEDEPAPRLCRGTLHSIRQFEPDVKTWGYDDARLPPWGRLTPESLPRI